MIPLPEPVNFSDVQLPGNDEFNRKFAVWGYTADQLRAYGDAREAAAVERLLAVAKRRADHEASAAAHHSGTWHEAHQHHLSAHKAMRDLIDAVWPGAAAIRSAA